MAASIFGAPPVASSANGLFEAGIPVRHRPAGLGASETGICRAKSRSGKVRLLLALMAFAATAAFRFLALRSFSNDHFMHVAWAQQLLLGAVPNRDFVDPGMPLTYMLSAVAMRASGGTLLGEALLTIGLLALTAGLTAWLAAVMTGSATLSLIAVTLQISLFPRLYSYPKLFVPVVAILFFWRYVDRPSRARCAIVAAWTAIAFLFRHDLGLYVAAGAIALLAFAPMQGGKSRASGLKWFGGTLLLALAPYAIFVAGTSGAEQYVRGSLAFIAGESNQWRYSLPTLSVGGDTSWLRLITMPLRVTERDTAVVWLYYLVMLLPMAGVAMACRQGLARDTRARLLSLSVLLLFANLGLLRHPLSTRLPDVAGGMPILLAFFLARGWSTNGELTPSTAFRTASAALVLSLTLMSGITLAQTWNELNKSRILDGIPKIRERGQTVLDSLGTWPWPTVWPSGKQPDVIRYLDACTAPKDRILIGWFAPEYYVFSRRGFGAGQVFLQPGFFGSKADQTLMIDRLRRDPPTIALLNASEDEPFRRAYNRLAPYLDANYFPIGRFTARNGSEITVFARRDKAIALVDAQSGWPCFR